MHKSCIPANKTSAHQSRSCRISPNLGRRPLICVLVINAVVNMTPHTVGSSRPSVMPVEKKATSIRSVGVRLPGSMIHHKGLRRCIQVEKWCNHHMTRCRSIHCTLCVVQLSPHSRPWSPSRERSFPWKLTRAHPLPWSVRQHCKAFGDLRFLWWVN